MDRIARIAWTATLLGASAATFAGMNTWTGLGPDGGTVNKVVYNRTTPTTVYMIAAGGLFRSLDEGATWQAIKTDFSNPPSDLDVDPTDQNRVYVVSPSVPTLLVSTDAGATFNPIPTPAVWGNIFQLEVASDSLTLYAASGTHLYRSGDRGQNWDERSAINSLPFLLPSRLHVDANDKNTVYAVAPDTGNTNALYVTHDGAAMWNPLPDAAAKAGYLYDVAFSSGPSPRIWLAGHNGIFVSSDGGLHFSPVTAPPLAGGGYLVSLNPSDATNVLVADGYGHLFRSIDEGAHWQNISDNMLPGTLYTVAIRPSQPLPHVIAGGANGLWLSTIGGTAWTPRNSGFKGAHVVSLSANKTADRIYLSALGGGVHYIDAGGTATAEANNGELGAYVLAPGSFYVPTVLAQDGAPGRLFASLDNRIARSLNGGSSWALMNYPQLSGQQVWRLTSSPGDPQVILAGGNGAPYRSADGGDNWSPATTGLPANTTVNNVVFASSNPLVAYATPQVLGTTTPSQSFGVYRSADAGLTWSPANTGISSLGVIALAVDPTDPKTVYISTDGQLWKSTTSGTSWSAIPSWQTISWNNATALAVDPVHPQIVYAAGINAIARSINRGDTWEVLRAGSMPIWLSDAMLLDPHRPYSLLVGTPQSGVQQLTIAPDLSLDLVDFPAGALPVGTAATYRYSVLNLGPFHATGAKLTLQLPASAQAVTVDTSAGACTTTAQTITCSLGDLRAGFSDTVTLHFTPSATGAFQVGGVVEADQPDVASGNNTNSRTASVAQISDLSVTATGSTSARVGDSVSYTLTVANNGPTPATDVQVIYQLGSGLTPRTATSSVGTCSVVAPGVTCSLGTLAVSSSATITVNATAAAEGSPSSAASVTTAAADTTAANNSASVITSIAAQVVTPPPAPPASPGTGSAGGGGGGGGRMSPLALLFLALVLAGRVLGGGTFRRQSTSQM